MGLNFGSKEECRDWVMDVLKESAANNGMNSSRVTENIPLSDIIEPEDVITEVEEELDVELGQEKKNIILRNDGAPLTVEQFQELLLKIFFQEAAIV